MDREVHLRDEPARRPECESTLRFCCDVHRLLEGDFHKTHSNHKLETCQVPRPRKKTPLIRRVFLARFGLASCCADDACVVPSRSGTTLVRSCRHRRCRTPYDGRTRTDRYQTPIRRERRCLEPDGRSDSIPPSRIPSGWWWFLSCLHLAISGMRDASLSWGEFLTRNYLCSVCGSI